MGLQFRRSIKICKGLKVNFGKTGASLTIGSGPFKRTFNTNGNVLTTVSLPGTGIYWTESKRSNPHPKNAPNIKRHIQSSDVDSNVQGYFTGSTKDEYIESTSEYFFDHQTENNEDKSSHYLFPQDIHSLYALSDDPVEWTELIAGATAEDLFMDFDKFKICRSIAKDILSGNIDAYLDIIEKIRPIDDLLLYCGDFEFRTDSASYMEVEFCAKPEIVLTNGMNDNLLQEFLGAVSIRVARNLIALLPISKVLLHVTIHERTVLSIIFERNILLSINYKFQTALSIIDMFKHRSVRDFSDDQSIDRLKIT